MTAKRRRLMWRISQFAETGFFAVMLAVECFRRPPRPSRVPLISGMRPDGKGGAHPLSETQLRQLEDWLAIHQKGWRRDIVPPASPSYSIQVEHADGTATFVYLFADTRSAIYFSRHGEDRRFDAGWLRRPVAEVEALIAQMKESA